MRASAEVTTSSSVGARSSDMQGRVYNNGCGPCPPPYMEDTPELPQHSGPLDLLRGAAFPFRAAGLVLRVPTAATAGAALRRRHPPRSSCSGAGRSGPGSRGCSSGSGRIRQGAVGWLWQADAGRLGRAGVAPRRGDPSPARARAARGLPGRGHRVGSGRTARPPGWHRPRRRSGALRGGAGPRSGSFSSSSARALLLGLQLLVPAATPLWAAAGVGLDRAVRLCRVPRPTSGPPRGVVCRGAAGACEAHRARPRVRAVHHRAAVGAAPEPVPRAARRRRRDSPAPLAGSVPNPVLKAPYPVVRVEPSPCHA